MKKREVDIQKLLEIYTLQEVIEISDLTDEDVLAALADAGLLKHPEVMPL